jgi:hypothetical protein
MQVSGVNWTGVKTDRYDEMASFFRTVAGLTVALEQSGCWIAAEGTA